MRVGITYLSPSSDVDRATTAAKYRDFFDQVEWANGRGFSGIWITEHHFSTYSLSASPLVLLAKAAAIAPDLRIGTGILVLPLWDPRRLVADVSTLDVLSEGRFDLGIGRGYQPHEFLGFGRELADSRAAFTEHVDLITRLFTETDTTFRGEFYSVDAPVTVLPRPVQTPHPPIWLAAVSEESTRFAVERGFHHLGLALSTPAELAAQWRRIGELGAEVGRSTEGVEFGANRFVYCSTDPEGRRAAAREVARQIQLSRTLAQGTEPVLGIAPHPAAIDPADEELAYQRLLAGTPDEIVEQLHEIADAGVTHVNAGFQYGALPDDVANASARLFADHVLPAVAELGGRVATVAAP
ncbi:LLM class flavin-dependent oxidoreductase [Saccharothrix syringae]|uniref:LLM class flavin-dependent oxidoreductase n=1 Tax=Saccharothrix syringae TaxID=103733 RepID=A0A5Q0GZ50_SACSY|nr:LLM class flavin-dependent oxidoreductase [Saccharothrix syringae]QFZ19219.1 LLM class flavin-dependent oxidoreductase [Saccharothrix syringae]